MQGARCRHRLEMVNVVSGFIIMEKCFKCSQITNYFSREKRPPLEEYRDGDHFWNVMDTAQSIRFDLRCSKCGMQVQYDELLGLMMCTGCDPRCEVNRIQKELEPERTWVYVAFGFLPVDEKPQLSDKKLALLEKYFNLRRGGASRSKIKIVSHKLVRDIFTCYAETIKDEAMLDLPRRDGS